MSETSNELPKYIVLKLLAPENEGANDRWETVGHYGSTDGDAAISAYVESADEDGEFVAVSSRHFKVRKGTVQRVPKVTLS